jgi:hypothetical protein
MKEHAGGAIPDGLFRVPVEWSDEHGERIAVSSFDPTSLDTLSDLCREELRLGRSIEAILQAHLSAWLEMQRREWICEGLKTALAEILSSQNPKKSACALCFVSGMDLTLGKSGPQLAKEFGVSKQDFFQEVERIQQRFGGRLVRVNMRDKEAREKMSKRNYRK